jgi:hypothetical protein
MLSLSPGGRRYGRYPDNPQSPARLLLAMAPPITKLSSAVDLAKYMGPIRDQGQEGSCTGQMGAELRDWLYRAFFRFENNRSVPADQFRSSASFIYKCNLIADGDLGQDVGSTIHQTFITLNRKGSCLEDLAPYHVGDVSAPPTSDQYAGAQVYRGGAYHYLPTLEIMKSCLASGYPFGFGIEVYESFESGELASTGIMPMPGPNEQFLGGHAQLVLGYDDSMKIHGLTGGLFIQNSWGKGWGRQGCYWMPYAYVTAGHCSDAWMMHLGPAWKPK